MKDVNLEDRILRETSPELLALMKVLLILQIYSVSLCKVMTFKTLIQDGTKLHGLQVKYTEETSWKVYTKCGYVSLYSIRPY